MACASFLRCLPGIGYLLLPKNFSKTVAENSNKHFLSHIVSQLRNSGAAELRELAQGLCWGCTQDVSWGCIIGRLYWGWGIHFLEGSFRYFWLLVGGPSSSKRRALYRLLTFSCDITAGFPQSTWSKKVKW